MAIGKEWGSSRDGAHGPNVTGDVVADKIASGSAVPIGLRDWRDEVASAGTNASEHGDHLESLVVTCCPPDYRQTGRITMVSAARHGFWLVSLALLHDEEIAVVSDLQLYLWCRRTRFATPPSLRQQWESFYRQGKDLVRRVVVRYCSPLATATDIEDLIQEVWREVVLALPTLVYDRSRGSLSAWLAGLAKHKVRRTAHRLIPFWARNTGNVEAVADVLYSSELGPEESYAVRETEVRLSTALASLREIASPENYDVFCWHFVLGWNFGEIGRLMGMSANEVKCRYYRTKRKWQTLARDFDLSMFVDEPRPVLVGGQLGKNF